MPKRTGPLLILLAGSLWGMTGVFVRQLNNYGVTTMQVAECRCTLAALIMLIIVSLRDRELLRVNWKRDWWPFAGAGFIGVIMFSLCYYYTIAATSMSIAALLLYTSPVFATLLSLLLFKEKLTLRKAAAVLLTMSGCVLVSGVISGAPSLTGGVLLVGLAAGLSYAMLSVFSRYALLKGYRSLTITTYTFVIAALCGAFFTDFSQIAGALRAAPLPVLGFMLLNSVFSTVIPYFVFTLGLTYVETSKAAIISSVEIVVMTLMGLLFYDEQPTLPIISGMVLIILALILLNMKSRRDPAPPRAKAG